MKQLLSLIIVLILSLPLRSQENPLDQKIKKIMQITGASQRFGLVMDGLIDIEEEKYKTIDSEVWDVFRSELKTRGYTELIELITPIYTKHLTEVEIDAIIAFYESEAGQSMIKKIPMVLQESMAVGEEWGLKFGQQILDKITASDELKHNIVLEDCSAFKAGEFSYKLPDGSEVKFTRKDDIQTEIHEDSGFQARIEWVTRCSYRLWEFDADGNELPGVPLEVNIYEINGNSYNYIASKEGHDFSSKGVITKVID